MEEIGEPSGHLEHVAIDRSGAPPVEAVPVIRTSESTQIATSVTTAAAKMANAATIGRVEICVLMTAPRSPFLAWTMHSLSLWSQCGLSRHDVRVAALT